jgi:hypothetical protein
MESVMGKAIERICLLVTSIFKSFIDAALSISAQKYLILLAKINVLNVAFKIPPIIDDFSALHLLIEVGNIESSLLLYTKNPFALQGFYSFLSTENTSANDYADELKKAIRNEGLHEHNFASVQIMYNYKESTLVPTKYFVDAEKENIISLMFGEDKDAYCFQENTQNQEIKIIYRIPQHVYTTMNELFSKNNFSHSTSFQVEQEGTILTCEVYHNQVKISLHKNNALMIVQYFDYSAPLDVCYHLLNVCERFEVLAPEVNLLLSGMIEAGSNLHNEIHKYFLYDSIVSLPQDIYVAEYMKVLPPHFFSNLTQLAQCVS